MIKIFDDVRRSVDNGERLNLKEIGLKRTPFYRLKEEEKATKLIVKRRDFIMNLKAEQECLRTSN